MNDLEKKKELAKRIAILCLEINSIGDERQIETDEGKPCVCFSLYGNVGTINIDVFEKGWEDYYPDTHIRLGKYSTSAEFSDWLAYLEELYKGQTVKDEIKKEVEERKDKELSGETDKAVGA